MMTCAQCSRPLDAMGYCEVHGPTYADPKEMLEILDAVEKDEAKKKRRRKRRSR